MLEFKTGDATRPEGDGPKIIAHVCNDVGAWGKGFVVALSKRWPDPEAEYRAWYAGEFGPFALGALQMVLVEPGLWVANMVAQRGVGWKHGTPPIRYDALAECLRRLGVEAEERSASVHMPRIGCGLAGGNWDRVEALVCEHLCDYGIPVTVYDLPRG